MIPRIDQLSDLPEAFTSLLSFYPNTTYYFISQDDLTVAKSLFQGASSQIEFENRMSSLNITVIAQDLS